MKNPVQSLKTLRYVVGQSLRVGHYIGQSRLGLMFFKKRPPQEVLDRVAAPQVVLEDLYRLYQSDFENIQKGIYKAPPDWGTNWPQFWVNSFKTFVDLFKVRSREAKHDVQDLPEDIKKQSFPSYYLQTFHYQTDGYLSDLSADLYDHQVELVFGGGAAAMRRQSLVPLRQYLSAQGEERELKLLDVACGTGTFLRVIKENYPDLHVTGTDLSPWYLKKAREQLSPYAGVDFVESNAETLPFKDASFDVLTNIFLFHELPGRVRKVVAAEMKRVLKPGGILIFQDALQIGDKPQFDTSLEAFPISYHEPFFLNFIRSDLNSLFSEIGLELVQVNTAFLSKIMVWKKTLSQIS